MARKFWVGYALERKDVEIAALVDINRNNAEKIKEEFNLKCGIYTDIREAIKESEANLVFDLTFVTNHRSIVVNSLECGCDVFGEKPMAMTLEESMDMVLKAKDKEKSYFVMQNRRYTAQARTIRDAISSGLIGDIGFVCADIFVSADLTSVRNQLENPMLQDNAIHTFDQARFFTGVNPVSAYCHAFNPKGSKYIGNAAGVCIFEMSDGSLFAFRCLMGAEGFHTSWESSWRIVGSKGTIMWDGTGNVYCECISNEKEVTGSDTTRFELKNIWGGREGHLGCLDDMFTALDQGRKAETDCTDNIWSMSMVYASLLSTGEQRKVYILDKDGYPSFDR